MASHWKSTPSYWCKFCTTYVRDSAIERKNHETSIKHQNNIQRSLRELHKTKEREDRDKQRAKDEVARLNGLVGGRKAGEGSGASRSIVRSAAPSNLDAAAQRKAHAEQLAAMGVQLPDELKKEVTGVGEWQTVSTRVVEGDEAAASSSLADILKQEKIKKEEEDSKDGVVKGVHKRRADDDEDLLAEEERSKKKAAWGSRLKSYPGKDVEEDDGEDLDALLSGVAARKRPSESQGDHALDEEAVDAVKEAPEDEKLAAAPSHVKPEDPDGTDRILTAPPVPVFKKRKSKK